MPLLPGKSGKLSIFSIRTIFPYDNDDLRKETVSTFFLEIIFPLMDVFDTWLLFLKNVRFLKKNIFKNSLIFSVPNCSTWKIWICRIVNGSRICCWKKAILTMKVFDFSSWFSKVSFSRRCLLATRHSCDSEGAQNAQKGAETLSHRPHEHPIHLLVLGRAQH